MMTGMPTESLHIAEYVDRSPADVYAYASDPTNIPGWAPGLGTAVERVGDDWFVVTPDGTRVRLTFAGPNEHLVLDHDVHLPTGDSVHNPFRVLPLDAGSEVVFTLRRQPGMSDEDFAADRAAVAADLARLKQILES